jgi:hypothetical protein
MSLSSTRVGWEGVHLGVEIRVEEDCGVCTSEIDAETACRGTDEIKVVGCLLEGVGDGKYVNLLG